MNIGEHNGNTNFWINHKMAVRQLMTICSDCFRRLNRDNYEPKEQ